MRETSELPVVEENFMTQRVVAVMEDLILQKPTEEEVGDRPQEEAEEESLYDDALFPSKFIGRKGHSCCGNDHHAVSVLNSADLHKIALRVSQERNIPIIEATQFVGQYY